MKYSPRRDRITAIDNTLASELYERIKARQPLIFVDSGDYEQFDRIMVHIAEREDRRVGELLAKKGIRADPLVRAPRIFEFIPGVGSVSFLDKYPRNFTQKELSDPHGVESIYHFLFEQQYENNDVLILRGGTRIFESVDSYTDVVDWVRMIVGNSLNDVRLACRPVEDGAADGEHADPLQKGRFLTLIVVGSDIAIPKALIPYSARLTVRKLSDRQIRAIVEEEVGLIEKRRGKRLCFGVDFHDINDPEKVAAKRREYIETTLPRLRGFSETEIRQLLRFASGGEDFNESSRRKIDNAKREMVERTGYLKLVKKDESPLFAGLENLVEYLNKTRKLAELPPEDLSVFEGNGLKGVLLVGMPGCGKSMAAKAAGQIFGWPVIGLDVGRLLGKYVGESERNLRMALEIAERAAPCVLWIDELEKAFSGLDSSDGTSMRLFGAFLTWLQEKTSLVYVIATANNVDRIPDEFKRKGRFDAIFRILLPNERERAQIFEFHLKKMLAAPRLANIMSELGGKEGLSKVCKELAQVATFVKSKEKEYAFSGDSDGRGFSGADIASVVNMSVADVLTQGGDISWPMLKKVLEDDIKEMMKTTQRALMTARKCQAVDGSETNAYDVAVNCLTKGGYRSASKEE